LVTETRLYHDTGSEKHQINVDSVVKAGCTLDNYLRNYQILESYVDDDIEETPENQLLPCTHTNSRSTSSASVVRQTFTDYFHTAGSFPWQADSVSRGKY